MVLVQYIFLQTSNTKGNNLLQTGASKFLQNWLPFTKASLSTALWLGTVGWPLGSMGEPWANWLGRLGTGKLMLAKRPYDIGLLVFLKISNIEPSLFDHTEHVSYIPISYIYAIKHRLWHGEWPHVIWIDKYILFHLFALLSASALERIHKQLYIFWNVGFMDPIGQFDSKLSWFFPCIHQSGSIESIWKIRTLPLCPTVGW